MPSNDSPFSHDSLAPPRPTHAPSAPAPYRPAPTPGVMPGVAPSFAPLPQLPPLPRSPSGAFVPGAPLSGPAAMPRFPAQPTTSPAPVASLGQPSYSSQAGGSSGPGTPAAGGQLPPPPITFPGAQSAAPARGRSAQLGGPTPSWPTIAPPPRSSPPSSPAAAAPALDPSLEQTADTDRPGTGLAAVLRRVWASPGAFAIVFAVGFVVTFAPGAVWKLRSPDLQAMIDGGQANAVVAMLEEREKDGSLGKGDWLLYGHAIATAYGSYRRSDMLAKYAVAVQSKRVDATALQNTIDALGDAAVQRDAIGVLKLGWPEDLAIEARLQERTGDDNVMVRRGAVDALVARNASSDMVRSARARVAVVDVKTRACPTTGEGVVELKALVSEKATTALRERKVADALLDLQGDSDLAQLPCIDKKTVKALQQQVAALLEGG